MTTTTPPQDADHNPTPAWWQDMVADALPTVPAPAAGKDGDLVELDDDLAVLLETIPTVSVPAAPAVPPMPTVPPVVPTQAADADDTVYVEPVSAPVSTDTVDVEPVSVDAEPPAKKPKKAKAASAPAAEPEPEEEAAEDVHPWWSVQQRRALADRAAYQIAGGYAARAAAQVAPVFDLPEPDPNAVTEKKLSAKKRAKLREAAGVDRAKRFRKWCTLTVLSACLGSEVHLPQGIAGAMSGITASGGLWAQAGAAGFFIGTTWAADWYLRGGTREQGATPVSLVRRGRLPVLVVVRAPFASALVAGLGADGLLAATTNAVNHLFS
ncbi:hypothetical protein [Kitasatospora sp. NBC_00315]|uniref:hypothetical protein n=1 Tax=Kitasatospora sp. NBC_00315 TaxID=2975963 RepID=UPI002F91A269